MTTVCVAKSKITTAYGGALFDVAKERGLEVIDNVDNNFRTVQEIFKDEELSIYKKLNSPLIARDEKVRIIEQFLKNKIEDVLFDLIIMLINRNRLKYIFEIFDVYSLIKDKHSGILKGKVKIAKLPNKNRMEMIIKSLSNITGKKVEVDFVEDASIMAGFVTFLGTHYIDYSLSTHLKDLENELNRS